MGPPWEGGTNVYINGPGHMTKMAATLIYGKTFKNLLQNQKSYDLETCHVAPGTQIQQKNFFYNNDDPGLTMTYLRLGQIRSPIRFNRENKII